MIAPTYGGDEVSALVIDIGSASTRLGFAGEDTPRCVLPSYVGADADADNGASLFGDLALHRAVPGREISGIMHDGLVEDFDAAAQLLCYGLETGLRVDVREHPVLVTEAGWNDTKRREKTMQLMFEELQAPATYLVRSGVCAAFAGGKAASLVIDIGAAATSITPVVDGLALRKGLVHSPVAGDFLSAATKQTFATLGIDIVPSFRVARKTQVEANSPAQAALRPLEGITTSFQQFHEEKVVLEWKETCAAVMERGYVENIAVTRPGKQFEFPDGYNTVFGAERYRVGESLLNPKMAQESCEAPSLPQLLQQSLAAIDPDVRVHLLNHVVLVGGSSLLPGLSDRLVNELQALAPGSKVRIAATGNSVERKFGGWLGGSILASLGTFHQMWVSRQEYDEHGPSIVEKRCR